MSMKRLLLILGLGLTGSAFAQSVSVKDGNIQFTDKAGQTAAVTSSGRDSDPVLSPDGKWIVFVRKVEGQKISTASDEVDPTELWQVRADGKEATLLLKCRVSQDPHAVIAGFENLQFSTNGKLVYFYTPAWATSGAIHVVDTTNRKERLAFAGNDFKVVRSGEFRDCVLVQQHRYFVGGGSYDWYWLMRPDGKEEGPVGETTENFDQAYLPP